MRPKVLLLDEATAALDAASVAAVESLIAAERQSGLAVLWVTHDPSQARRIADRQLVMEAGCLRPEEGLCATTSGLPRDWGSGCGGHWRGGGTCGGGKIVRTRAA